MDNEQHDNEVFADVWGEIGSSLSTYLTVTQNRIASELLTDAQRAANVMDETIKLVEARIQLVEDGLARMTGGTQAAGALADELEFANTR
ncbi:MAG TPA: hypothetical protein DCF45_12090 [Gammaproteobacteria bacterium]|nr:hypothetical protein [Gammaproteobacteria bacterium]